MDQKKKVRRQLDKKLTLKLIAEVKKRPIIWDKRLKVHRELKQLNEAWTEIAREISLPKHFVLSQWKIILGCFRTYKAKVRKSQLKAAGSDKVYKPVWFAFDAMVSFMSKGTDMEKLLDSTEIKRSPSDDEDQKPPLNDPLSELESSASTSDTIQTPTINRLGRTHKNVDHQQAVQVETTPPKDLFLDYISLELQNLPEMRQLEVRNKLFSVIAEERLVNLNGSYAQDNLETKATVELKMVKENFQILQAQHLQLQKDYDELYTKYHKQVAAANLYEEFLAEGQAMVNNLTGKLMVMRNQLMK